MFCSIGELFLDVTIAPQGQLNLDDDSPASIQLGGGGQAANFCAWSVSLGERAQLISRVGEDETGRRLLAEIEAAGVLVRPVWGPEPTGAIAVLVGAAGERTFARQRGASSGLRPADLEEEWFDGVELLHLPAYCFFVEPLGAASRRAVVLARARGALLSIDLSSAAGLREFGGARMADEIAVLQPELLFATETEAAELGTPLEGLGKVPVIKLGRRGCRVFGRVVPAPAVRELDGTGAGDAFAAGFCAAYMDGATPLEAAGRAVLVGARAVTKLGARP